MEDYSKPIYDKPRNWIREKREHDVSWEKITLAMKKDENALVSFLEMHLEEDYWPELPAVDNDYMNIRNDLQALNREVRKAASEVDSKKADYYVDCMFGLKLYEYLDKVPDFSMRVAADDDFWRYMSLKVIPDIVSQRWGKDNESHFWSRSTRIWLRSIWWYVHLAWQGDYESTEKLLLCPHFTTDTILNFEERSGRRGTHVEAYRNILKLYSRVSESDLKKFSRGKKNRSDDIFRIVMKLNTAKALVIEPSLYPGGEYEYARSLFADAGVNIDVT